MNTCRAAGCSRRTVAWGSFCASHKSRDRRHGDPFQEAITVSRLRPYADIVRRWVARQPRSDIWEKLEAVWAALVAEARGVLAERDAGHPNFSWYVEACENIVKVAEDVEPRRVVETMIAFGVLWEREARAFRSDRAAWMQAARRFRGLTERNAGAYWDNSAGRLKRVYRDPSPRAGQQLGKMLLENLGVIGIRIARAEEGERKKLEQAKDAAHSAVQVAF